MSDHLDRLREAVRVGYANVDAADLAALLSERDALAAVAEAPLNAGLLLKLLAESDIATTTYNDVRRVLVAVCAAYDRTVAKP